MMDSKLKAHLAESDLSWKDFESVVGRYFLKERRLADIERTEEKLRRVVEEVSRKYKQALSDRAKQKDIFLKIGERVRWTEREGRGIQKAYIFEGECIDEHKDFYLIRLKSGAKRTIRKKGEDKILGCVEG